MYDNAFIRAWRLYLAGCAAAFKASSIQLFQVVFTHPGNNRIPMTREGLYRDGDVSDAISGGPNSVTWGQGGLLDIAIHPDFEANRLVYFTYAGRG